MLATVPVVQLVSLGYLLEVSGRVARSGRLREALVGVWPAARLGGVLLCLWLLAWPPRLAASLWTAADLIDPASPAASGWRWATVVLTVLVAAHAAGALLRGGRLRDFLWPRPLHLVRQLRPATYRRAVEGVGRFVDSLRVPYYFWLGARGLAGAVLWLAAPVTLLVVASRLGTGLGVVLGLVGGAGLALAIVHLPAMQARFAATGQFTCFLSLRQNRLAFARAPLAGTLAVLLTLAVALPLYLLKGELLPREAAWLPSLLFVMAAFPARVLCGWAAARAARRESPAHWCWRWLGRATLVPAAAAYAGLVYLSQFFSWYGAWSLYEQHAVLLPVPFLNY
jgi:hypothetical protein